MDQSISGFQRFCALQIYFVCHHISGTYSMNGEFENHCSKMLLLNPYGLFFSETTVQSLLWLVHIKLSLRYEKDRFLLLVSKWHHMGIT